MMVEASPAAPRMPVDVFDVASYFARQDGLQGEPDVTPMKLQKLLYLAQAHYLAAMGTRLFDEDIEAYEHGPVITRVWSRYAGLRSAIIDTGLEVIERNPLPPTVEDFLDRIWARYKDLSASALRRITHGQAPWRDNFVEGALHTRIPDLDMIQYFGTVLPLHERVPPQLPAAGSAELDADATLFDRDRSSAVTVDDELGRPLHYALTVNTVIE